MRECVMFCKYIFETFNKEEASEKFCLQIIFTYIYIQRR